jgi:hypothetical protein
MGRSFRKSQRDNATHGCGAGQKREAPRFGGYFVLLNVPLFTRRATIKALHVPDNFGSDSRQEARNRPQQFRCCGWLATTGRC